MTDTERRALLLIADLSRSVGFLIGAVDALSPQSSSVLDDAKEQARQDLRRTVELIWKLLEAQP